MQKFAEMNVAKLAIAAAVVMVVGVGIALALAFGISASATRFLADRCEGRARLEIRTTHGSR